jgi:hypothetical protein
MLGGAPYLEAHALPVATAISVRFGNTAGEAAHVEVSDADGPLLASESWDDGLFHEQALLGVPEGATLTVRLVNDAGEELFESTTVETGFLPATTPRVSLEGDPGWEGYIVTSLLGEVPAAAILDERGNIVFYAEESEPGQLFRARLRNDHGGLYWLFVPDDLDGEGPRIVRMDWSDEYGWSYILGQSVTHDFVELDDGVIGVIGDGLRETGSNDVSGNVILECDGVNVEQVWSTEDAFPEVGGGLQTAGVWTHANALDYEPAHDSWRIGLRNLSTLAEIDRATGETLDTLGGVDSNWSFGEGAAFDHEHQFQFVDVDGDDPRVLVHDNRDSSQGSRVVELGFNRDADTVSLQREFVHDPPLYVFAMGDMDRAADGSTLITWSSAGAIDDFDADGAIRASLYTEFGAAFGYTQRLSALPKQTRLR